MKVVTSGDSFLDIDAFAGCIGYAELLNLEGDPAIGYSSAPLNQSITPSLRKLGTLSTNYIASINDEFVLMDVSDPENLDPVVVNLSKVVEVFDHHSGFERDWKKKLHGQANIESIGAACTLVTERWLQAGKFAQMSPATAQLMAAAILDNTLNFKATISIDRDHKAYAELIKHAKLPADFAANYFSECQEDIESNLPAAIRSDTKRLELPLIPKVFGQLVVWDARGILAEKRGFIHDELGKMDADWAMNVIGISDGRSHFLADNPVSQAKFSELLGVTFKDGLATADRLWLRKEILKEAIDRTRIKK